jgi:NTE family protein
VVGIAWEAGLVAGLAEGGIDLRSADTVIGTSAGAIVGAWVASGRDPEDAGAAPRHGGGDGDDGGRVRPDPKHLGRIFRTWAAYDQLGSEERRAIGAMALEAPVPPEDRSVAWIARQLDTEVWPATLRVTAVDAVSGDLRVFDAASGVPLERAVAASCSVPGIFAPVHVGGRRYIDGGVRSGTSADLAAECAPDHVLVVAPITDRMPGIGRLMQRLLDREAEALRARRFDVATITPSTEELGALGFDFMDPSRRAAAHAAGRRRGQREAQAESLRGWREPSTGRRA